LAPQGVLVIVRLAAPSRCVRLTANVKTQMALLTDILIASDTDAGAIFERYPAQKNWPAVELRGLDNTKLAALLRAFGDAEDASMLEGEGCIAVSSEGGPWVFLLPDSFRDRLANSTARNSSDIAARWVQDEELAFDGWSAADVAPLVDILRSHASQAAAASKKLVLWMSL
jgi:hypothetical protein